MKGSTIPINSKSRMHRLILRALSLRKTLLSSTVKITTQKRKLFNTLRQIYSESQGSVFQKNAAVFYGTDAPQAGERPFKIQKVIP
jgi:hypothetical protein